MTRIKCLVLFILLALTSHVALGNGVKRVPAGAIAYHFIAKISFFFDGVTPPDLVGYIAFIEGVPGPFFDGPPSVNTALFTIRFNAGPPPVQLDPGSNVLVQLLPPGGSFDIYLDRTPNQTWGDPGSFSDGELVATFSESALLSTAVIEPDGSGVGFNYFSSKPIFSKNFRLNGKWVNFKRLVPNGTTSYNLVSQTPVPTDYADRVTFAFAGSAIAIGGPRSRSDDDDDN